MADEIQDSLSDFAPTFSRNSIGRSGAGATIDDATTSDAYAWSSQKIATELNKKANKASPVITGSVSMGRKSGTTVGTNSVAIGNNVTAAGNNSQAFGDTTEANNTNASAEGYKSVAGANHAHAEGNATSATGLAAHAEGGNTKASGGNSHAEGKGSIASGAGAHAEGSSTLVGSTMQYTSATGTGSHAEGVGTLSSNTGSHSEGTRTTASAQNAHAEGSQTTASGSHSHSEGWGTEANHRSQHVFGEYNVVDSNSAAATARGTYVEIVGNGITSARSNARTLDWDGNEVLAGKLTLGSAPTANMDAATKQYVDTAVESVQPSDSKADKADTVLTTTLSRGRADSTNTGAGSIAFGSNVAASGDYSQAVGVDSIATGRGAHAEGISVLGTDPVTFEDITIPVTASGAGSHAEGIGTSATNTGAHSEGGATTASNQCTHAEGYNTTASGIYAHSEGQGTFATGNEAHSEGRMTEASGEHAHSEGYGTTASGTASHAEGNNTIANHKSQRTFGEYNVADTSTAAATARGNYIEIVGNGTGNNARSNARTLDWDGNEQLAGRLRLGADPVFAMDAATKKMVDDKADYKDTTLSTTLSRDRKAGTTVGVGSIAFGDEPTASNDYTVAFG